MRRLTLEERILIEKYVKKGYSGRLISKILGRNASVISMEIHRFADRSQYDAQKAHEQCSQGWKKGGINSSRWRKSTIQLMNDRLTNLEMQLKILYETIKELKNDSKN